MLRAIAAGNRPGRECCIALQRDSLACTNLIQRCNCSAYDSSLICHTLDNHSFRRTVCTGQLRLRTQNKRTGCIFDCQGPFKFWHQLSIIISDLEVKRSSARNVTVRRQGSGSRLRIIFASVARLQHLAGPVGFVAKSQ